MSGYDLNGKRNRVWRK